MFIRGSKWAFIVAVASGCSGPAGKAEGVALVRQELENEDSAIVSVLLTDPAQAADVQRDVAELLSDADAEVLHAFAATPGMSIRLDSVEALELLSAHPGIARVDVSPSGGGGLDDSRPIVGANEAFAAGFTGAGRRVAVLDSGIQGDHPDLSDDLVAEACVCNTGDECCPNGTNFQVGPGAAADDHGHGTHVSGIITSAGVVAPRGIAPEAGVVVVRMMLNNSFNSAEDITASLEWVLANHPEVDAVNMSLQTGALFPANCDVPTATYTPPAFIVNMANVVQALRERGVTTVTIAGNHSSKSSTSAPGCLSNVVTVGNTTKENAVNPESNSDPGLDLLAPGTDILSTLPGGYAGYYTGTSMAAPHVSAAIALLREQDSIVDASRVSACLGASPTLLTDTNGISRPLLNIPAALETCAEEENDLEVRLPAFSSWQDGYCMGVEITNRGSRATAGWKVTLDLRGTTIVSSWNARLASTAGLTSFESVSFNRAIQPGRTLQSASVGFCASRPLNSGAVAVLVDAESL